REMVAAPPMVWAPGGGWVTNSEVLGLVRPPGRIIHLRISPEAALMRLARSRIVRPLLKRDDPQTAMTELWARRAELYALADVEIDVELVDSQRVVQQVVALARNLTTGLG
ncbi:MAG: shikimate kinase, partial [Gemmatimonas sp.]